MEPAAALERISYLLDRARERPYRVRAYLRAAEIVKAVAPDELVARVAVGTFKELDASARRRRRSSRKANGLGVIRTGF